MSRLDASYDWLLIKNVYIFYGNIKLPFNIHAINKGFERFCEFSYVWLSNFIAQQNLYIIQFEIKHNDTLRSV